CGAVTALPGSGSAAASTSVEHARPAPRHVLAEPACVDTRELSDGAEFTVKWYKPLAWLVVGFMVVFDAIVYVVYARLIEDRTPWVAWVPLSVFGIAALALSYFTVAMFTNTTRITATREHLGVRHGPLPWPGRRALASADVVRVYTRRRASDPDDPARFDHDLWVELRDEREIRLLRGAFDAQTTGFLEQELARTLRLPREAAQDSSTVAHARRSG
ncbi:MAG: hypothetical protein IT453_05390, partial [Planctomycetes bacterium]|nr:hypothetical protein [Planctomycetota bacterium]